MPHSRRSRSKGAADDNAPRQRSQQDSGEASATRRALPLGEVPDEENGDRKRTSSEFGGGEIGESSQAIQEKVERVQSSEQSHSCGPETAGPSSQLGIDSNGNGQIDGVERRNLESDLLAEGTISSRVFGEPQVASSMSAEPDDDKYSGGPSPTSSASLSSNRATCQRGFDDKATDCSGSLDARDWRECASRPNWSWSTFGAAINCGDSGICTDLHGECRPFSNSPSSAVVR